MQTNLQPILPPDTTDTIIVFEVDTWEHTAQVYHLRLATNIDLFDDEPCSHERIKELAPIVTLKMQPASAYSPPALAKLLIEKVVDLR